MNLFDALIIYLACGAPIGVYYFLQNRRIINSNFLWLKTSVVFLFWIPFAFQVLSKNNLLEKLFKITFDKQIASDSKTDNKIALLRKTLETTIIEYIPQNSQNIPKLSLFEVREIFDRYIGLTAACQIERKFSRYEGIENEFFQISKHKNADLATICFDRRNRKRLFFHQTQARRDFLNLVGILNSPDFYYRVIEFVKILEDFESIKILEKLTAQTVQIEKTKSVKNTEKEIWKSETRKPLHINQTTSANMKLNLTTMNLRGKD